MVKLKPHHDLAALQAKFASVDTLSITVVAALSADALGFQIEDVVEVIQQLKRSEFRKSETAHSPTNPRVWHDTYVTWFDDLNLYVKFAGEALLDVWLVSFKEV